MTLVSSRARNTVAALLAAATLGVAAAPSAANAGGWKNHHHGGHGWGHRGYGYGAAALGGGLLLGALIASNSRTAYVRDCWFERVKRVNAYGDIVVRRVRVCD